jgi:hypothetical protein
MVWGAHCSAEGGELYPGESRRFLVGSTNAEMGTTLSLVVFAVACLLPSRYRRVFDGEYLAVGGEYFIECTPIVLIVNHLQYCI